jgi:hypothetical protein
MVNIPQLISHQAAFSLAAKIAPSESTRLTTGRRTNRDLLRDQINLGALYIDDKPWRP